MQGSLDEAHQLAEQVADGSRIDWGSLTLDDERFLSNLRAVERLADFHRKTWEELLAEEADDELLEWGQLKVVEKVGQGGFGEVYLAVDPALEREVALKLLHLGKGKEAAQKASVLKEGRLLAKIRHPNVATVYGVAEHEGRLGLWMEFVRGQTLEQLMESQGPASAREAAGIGIEVCKALAAVHGQGLVHRDVKAQNVMRREGGRILLMDFGLGEQSGSERKGKRLGGTPLYMPPEVLKGEPATPQSDIYSVGVLLFYLSTGEFPVESGDFEELRQQHESGKLKLLSDVRSNLPNWFVDAVHRALASKPAQRFETVGQMERALSSGLSHSGPIPAEQRPAPRPAPRKARLTMAALAALLLVAAYFLLPDNFLRDEPISKKPLGVVFADLTNQTGDAEFDSLIVDRLRQELESRQLATIEFADEQDLKPAFDQLGIANSDPIDPALARQIASQLYRVPAVIAVYLSKLGRQHELTIEIERLEVGPYESALNRHWRKTFPFEQKEDLNKALADAGNWLIQAPLERIELQADFFEAFWLRFQRPAQAIVKLDRIIDDNPEFTVVYAQKTSLLMTLQQFHAAYQNAARALTLIDEKGGLPTKQDQFAKMLLLHDTEDFSADERLIREMIDHHGESADWLFYLGYAQMAQGGFEQAQRTFARAFEINPTPSPLIQLAYVQLIEEDWPGVEDSIRSLSGLEDTAYDVDSLRGAIEWLRGNYQQADDAFQKLRDPADSYGLSEGYSIQAYMLAERGKYRGAKNALAKGIDHDRSDEELLGGLKKAKHIARAYILVREGSSDIAQILEDLREATLDGDPHYLLRAGTILARADLIDEARSYLRRLQDAQIKNPIYRRAIQKLEGEILIADGQEDAGLSKIQEAAADDPAFYFRDYLAHALNKAGRLDEATDVYADIIDQPGILWFLSVYEQYPGIYADTLLEAGRLLAERPEHREEARWALEQYLKLREEADQALQGEVAEARRRLEEIGR